MDQSKEIEDLTVKALIKICTPKQQDYHANIYKLIGMIQKKKMHTIYISTTRCLSDIEKELKGSGLKGPIHFVDTLSKKLMRNVPVENCYFVDSPADLNGIVTGFTAMKKECDEKGEKSVIVFDNINNLMLDNEQPTVLRFLYNFFCRIRAMNIPALIVFLADEKESKTLDLLESIADGDLEI